MDFGKATLNQDKTLFELKFFFKASSSHCIVVGDSLPYR
jgi:hypothetical protein